MGIEFRLATPDEFPAVAEVDGANFGFHYSAEELADARLDLDPDRIVIATDDQAPIPRAGSAGRPERIVAVSAETPLRLAVPGGDLSAMGLTWVSVEVTHRRRGVLRSMIERQLRAHAGEGFAATILHASEGGIYGRYGFGVASYMRRVAVDRLRSRLACPVDAGAVRRLTTDEARELLPGLHERWRRSTPGAVSRDARRWQYLLLDREHQRDGASGLFHLVHPDGYVTYRIRADWGDGNPAHECRLVDYAPVTAEAHAALWQTLLGMDLVRTIGSRKVPLDDPLPHLLTDCRRVETVHVGDDIWLRPLDVPTLLGSRRYATEVETVIEVLDPLLGDGRYRLCGSPDGATCRRTDATTDLTLPVATLGAVSLGGQRLTGLARAGQASGDPAMLARLDLALLADRLPLAGTQI